MIIVAASLLDMVLLSSAHTSGGGTRACCNCGPNDDSCPAAPTKSADCARGSGGEGLMDAAALGARRAAGPSCILCVHVQLHPHGLHPSSVCRAVQRVATPASSSPPPAPNLPHSVSILPHPAPPRAFPRATSPLALVRHTANRATQGLVRGGSKGWGSAVMTKPTAKPRATFTNQP